MKLKKRKKMGAIDAAVTCAIPGCFEISQANSPHCAAHQPSLNLDEIVVAGKKSYPRFKERVEVLREKLGEDEARAKAATEFSKEGYAQYQMIQYYDQGLRAGYLADQLQENETTVWVRPIGPAGRIMENIRVKLENVVAVLDGIFAPQEIKDNMAKVKAVGKKVRGGATSAQSRAGKTNGEAKAMRGRTAVDSVIKLLKAPKEGELRGQALIITNILKDNNKKMGKFALIEAIGKAVESKNVLGAKDIWAMNRKKLIDAGYVSEDAGAKAEKVTPAPKVAKKSKKAKTEEAPEGAGEEAAA